MLSSAASTRHLPLQHLFRLARLALGLGLADARDHVEAGSSAAVDAARHRLVGLAEVLPALGVADDRAVDPELDQHRRRDLAGERALACPVAVLREHPDVRAREGLHRLRERDVRRADRDVDVAEVRLPQRAAELARLAWALEHLPVAGDEHQEGIAAIPGRSLPSSSSSEAPPPVEIHEIRSATPASCTARTESPPPTTV